MTTAPRARVQRRPVHGVLLLDKPLGLSSNQALQKAKWLLRAEKAGHTGTLDPLATGVLPLCFGAATKFSGLHLDADKTYEATLQLGVRTATGDAEGEVIERRPVPALVAADLQAVRQRFVGRITQVPPMHSALKKDGKALYEYARQGLEVERAPREVTIFELNLAPASVEHAPTAINMLVTCSKGTYIRTLGEDIGAALGCGGHLTRLRRMATGPFGVAHCCSLAELEAMEESARLACLLLPEALLSDHTPIVLGGEDAGRFLSGMRRRGNWLDAERVAVFGDQPRALLGTAHVRAGELIPGRLMSPVDLRQMLGACAA
ncbi:tRNA pseudouridine(55) synthase TruB [Ottowia sp.]|uniref:tRNA pseudouridine(55) synthase TruB n=1 Tax=Ottowia sp. TaxID=1898956 RepID=UPI0025DBB655|nr:tRNA pseudouridine(55) synthase TruB [Ottowia sp.]MBK6612827.1 tRNA pseudouridine(55) synthase TruB [Ottowia sp.]MBK6748045.1 tRNA pseudouridine(55) synthase TruB [Ottowia sp.]